MARQTAAEKKAAEAEAEAARAAEAEADSVSEPDAGVHDAARAVLEQRIAELEAEVEQLTAANADLEARLPSGDPVDEEPAAGTNVWVRTGDGREWEVTVGNSVYERLRSEGAQIIPAPSAGEESA